MTDFELDKLCPGMVAVIGVPLDENSSFMHGAAMAPPRIREALHSGSMNLCAESGIDLGTEPNWLDLGDLELPVGPEAFARIERAVARLLARGAHVLALGGDHSITYPILRAYARQYPGLTILHLDAHPDLYDEFDGNRQSHACPFARIMEDGLAARLTQVGVRTMNPHQRQQAERFGVRVIEMQDWRPGMVAELDGPVYLSLDMDVLDPAFAPGVSHHEPGGLSTRDVLGVVQNVRATIVGADVVEFNPARDPVGITAMTAAKFYKEVVARIVRDSTKP